MTNSKSLIVAGVVSALLPVVAIAETSQIQGYLLDSRGAVVKNHYGQCWRTGYWTPAMAIAECDPDLVKKVEAPAPARVAAAPRSVPMVAAIEPEKSPAKKNKVSFSADALFAFDKATLKPEGKLDLDRFVQELKGVSYDTIYVVGHTDRIGTDTYNQTLSEQRANAVRDYLVARDIEPNRISVVGRGESQPITQSGDCTGPKSQKLISCLQPDRRVDIEVSGKQ